MVNVKGEDVQNIPGPTPNFGWPQNAKLGLELALACSDLKLEDVRFISQYLGGLGDMKTFGQSSEEDQRDLYQ